jgi:hypothetical protein
MNDGTGTFATSRAASGVTAATTPDADGSAEPLNTSRSTGVQTSTVNSATDHLEWPPTVGSRTPHSAGWSDVVDVLVEPPM